MEAGSGNSIYIDGTGLYKKFIGSNCIFFKTNYLENTLVFKSKCKKSVIIYKQQNKLLLSQVLKRKK